MESCAAVEKTGIFGVETEHQPHAEDIKAAERFGTVFVDVLLKQFIIDDSDQLSGFDADFHLAFEMFVTFIHKELQAVVFLFEVLEKDLLRFAVGLLHIIYPELAEVARHDPTRTLTVGQFRSIALGLLEGIERCSVGLLDRRTEIFVERFLLNHHFCGRDETVDERRVVKVYLLLIEQERVHVLHAEHLGQKCTPKDLALAFLVAFALPEF